MIGFALHTTQYVLVQLIWNLNVGFDLRHRESGNAFALTVHLYRMSFKSAQAESSFRVQNKADRGSFFPSVSHLSPLVS